MQNNSSFQKIIKTKDKQELKRDNKKQNKTKRGNRSKRNFI